MYSFISYQYYEIIENDLLRKDIKNNNNNRRKKTVYYYDFIFLRLTSITN